MRYDAEALIEEPTDGHDCSVSDKQSKRAKRKQRRSTAAVFSLRMNDIVPKTDNQELVFNSFEDGEHLFLHGFAGTGKTFIAIYLAMKEILNPNSQYSRMIIVRSAVPTRNIGFLPGSEMEKTEIYELPYYDIYSKLFNRGDAYEIAKRKGLVTFLSTSHIRGITLDNCIVIIDECENLNFHENDTIITRLGENTRVVFCGDFGQSDFTNNNERLGILKFMDIIQELNEFRFVEFEEDDIVRGPLVKNYIIAKNRMYGTRISA